MTSNNVPHTFKKKLEPFVESSRTKEFHKSSYTIPKGPPEKRCGE